MQTLFNMKTAFLILTAAYMLALGFLESLIDSFVEQMSQDFMLPVSRCRTIG